MPKLEPASQKRFIAAAAGYNTQREAAAAAGVSESALCDGLKGKSMSVAFLEACAEAWGETYTHHPERVVFGVAPRKKRKGKS